MEISLEHLATKKVYDVCIIGAGAAGLSIANELIQNNRFKKSISILLLESGIKSTKDRIYAPWAKIMKFIDPRAQKLYEGKVSGFLRQIDPNFLTRSRSRVFGGSTNCWGGWTTILSPIDFESRQWPYDSDQCSPGWPIQYEELARYYDRAMHTCSLAIDNWDNPYPMHKIYRNPDFWVNQFKHIESFEENEKDQLHTEHIQYINEKYCRFGNSNGIGGNIQKSDNITIVRNANVLSLQYAAEDANISHTDVCSIKGNKWTGYSFGVRRQINAKYFVLATGGIENVRIMQLSNLLSGNKWLGKGFSGHCTYYKAAKFSFSGLKQSGDLKKILQYYTRENINTLNHKKSRFRAIITPKSSTLRQEKIGNFRLLLEVDPSVPSSRIYHASINISWEEFSQYKNQLALSNEIDYLGQKMSHLQWNLSPHGRHTVTRALELAHQFLDDKFKLNFYEQIQFNDQEWKWNDLDDEYMSAGDHHLGATRMSLKSDDGVVDENLKVHGIENLYIAGGSVFPSSGFANPTLTIIALAIRLSDHLHENI